MTLTIVLAIALIAVSAALAKGPKLTTLTAETITAVWTCQDHLGVPRTRAASPWKPHSHSYRMAELARWQHRLASCRAVLHKRAHDWNWQAWLPPVWRAIGECETQLNWRHDSGTYQGAFGFYRGSWDAFRLPGYPSEAYLASPWQQYQVALRIHARFGFSGWGCYTHGGYLSHL